MKHAVAIVLTGLAFAIPLHAQSLPQDPENTRIAATPGYSFHVDFWANLHDYLYWRVQDDGPSTERAECIAAQPVAEMENWLLTESYYRENMADRHWRRDPLMRAMRFTLSGVAPQADSTLDAAYKYLRDAAPVYRSCFWARHSDQARQRLATILPLLVVEGPDLKNRLSEYYGSAWPETIHVDIVPMASFAGANTATGPDTRPHMQISSIDPDLVGLSGLELLLHEASHEIFGRGRGLVGETIVSASEELGVRPPRDLWHAISFFTSGYAMEQMAGASGVGYEPYWTKGLFERAWPEYVEPIRSHWTPYLRGDVSADQALRAVIGAIAQ